MKETVKADRVFSDGTKTHDNYEVTGNGLFNVSPFVSAGLSYRLSTKVRVATAAIGRYGVMQINSQPMAGSLINIGINFSCFVYL